MSCKKWRKKQFGYLEFRIPISIKGKYEKEKKES